MKLKDYIEKNGLSVQKFADSIGVDRTTVLRYFYGRKPNEDTMLKIYKITNGKIQPNDFYSLPKLTNTG